jgi:Tol biopolymer transport system component
MKFNAANVAIMLSVMLLFTLSCQQYKTPLFEDPYLGQKPPGMKPEKFAPGIISTSSIEFEPVFSPDGKAMFFTRFDEKFKATIMMTKYEGGTWSPPEIAPFSSQYAEGSAFYSLDGNRIYYESKQPISGNDKPSTIPQIWYVEKNSDGWSEPNHIGYPEGYINNWWNPTIAHDDTLYFSGSLAGEKDGTKSIFYTKLINSKFTKPEKLFEVSANLKIVDAEPSMAPDGTYMIFYSAGRPDQLGEGLLGDLYISFRKRDGSWTQAKNMGEKINTVQEENWPVISPDGKYIFFCSNIDSKNGFPDIYWVDAKIIDELKPVD